MTDQNGRQETKRSSFLVTAIIISVILAMSAAFFWAGNFFYGVVMIGIPVLSIMISTGCYIAHKNQPAVEQFVLGDVDFRETEDDNGPGLADQPPDYRLTWRRSFMKRMKQFRQSAPNGESSRGGDIEEGNEGEVIDLDGRQKQTTDAQISNTPSCTPSEAAKEIAPTEDLPTYNEALEIIASRENLSQ